MKKFYLSSHGEEDFQSLPGVTSSKYDVRCILTEERKLSFVGLKSEN
jgi:hypothetical protein